MPYFNGPDDASSAFFQVDGWVNKYMPEVMRFSVAMLEHFGITTRRAGEIGVHHGRFFLVLEELCEDSGHCDAFDVFEDQFRNLDRSGRGAYDRFMANVQSHARRPERVRAFKVDSMDLAAGVADVPRDLRYDLFSVDGCHTALHTCNDLMFAERSLAPGGIVIVDDISNMSWMSVFEGVVRYLYSPAPRLAPFAVGLNKLLLTSVGDQERYFEHFRAHRPELASVPALQGGPTVTRLKDFKVLRYSH